MSDLGTLEWPADVPPPGQDADWEMLDALHREQQRVRGEAPKPAAKTWTPPHPIARAIWERLPESGRGVEYVQLLRGVASRGNWRFSDVQQAMLGLVLLEKAYVTPGPGGTSLAGRGDDPRCGAATIRTGALGGLTG